MWEKKWNEEKQVWQIIDDGVTHTNCDDEVHADLMMKKYHECKHIEFSVEVGIDNDYSTFVLTCDECSRVADFIMDTEMLEWIG